MKTIETIEWLDLSTMGKSIAANHQKNNIITFLLKLNSPRVISAKISGSGVIILPKYLVMHICSVIICTVS